MAALSVHAIAEDEIATLDALNRVLARDLVSPEDLPAFIRSTVDGYALRSVDSYGASDSLPGYFKLVGEVRMGSQPAFRITLGQAALIHTGGMLPEGADAVVMLENTQKAGRDEIEVLRAVSAEENTIQAGEDVRRGEVVLQAGKRIRAVEIGSLLALGITRILVARLPKVGIISSGDELTPPQQKPGMGQVRDINTYTLTALAHEWGGIPVSYGILPDRPDVLKAALEKALHENDLVLVTAGSSASERDLTAGVIAEIGAPGVLVHGVNVKPGKPTILAVCNQKPVIGLPGNPVSALVIARLFVRPVIDRLLGKQEDAPFTGVEARLAVNLSSQAGREDWMPVMVRENEEGYIAEPVFYKSNLIFTLSRANGLIRIPADDNGLEAGSPVRVFWL